MNLRDFFRNLMAWPAADTEQEIAESQRKREETERQQKEIAMRLAALGYDVDLRRRSNYDHGP